MLEAGCIDVKCVWLVRFAVLWLAILMTVMARCSQEHQKLLTMEMNNNYYRGRGGA